MVYDHEASGGRGGPTQQELHRTAAPLVEHDEELAPTDEKLIISVSAMQGIHTACDKCSRSARYVIRYGHSERGEPQPDEWLCRPHLRRLLGAWLGQLAE